MSSSNCCFFPCIEVSQQAGTVVWYSHLFKNFPQFVLIHTVKGFDVVNKAKVDVFLELSSFLNDPANVGNLISGSSAFSKTRLNIWKFIFHVLLKPGLENFEHYFASVWDECNCAVVWAFFGSNFGFLWDWNEYIMRNSGLDETQAGIKITGRNINDLRYADDTTLMAESKELKRPLMKVKEESEKVGLKFNIQKTKVMASGPIPSWQIGGETVTEFIFGGLQSHCGW